MSLTAAVNRPPFLRVCQDGCPCARAARAYRPGERGARREVTVAMNARLWRLVRMAGAAAVLVCLAWRVGTGPFVDGLLMTSGWSLMAGAGIAALTTACCAWRWRLVAGGLGMDLRLGQAVRACYRSQFLNATLPGGVAGDVDRGIRHGRGLADVPRGLRAVAWERTAGQVVQIGLAVVVLLVMPTPLRPTAWLLAAALMVAGGLGLAVARSGRRTPHGAPPPGLRMMRTASADLRGAVLSRGSWPGVLAASAVVATGHLVTFLVAARITGAALPLAQLVPLGFLVLLASAVPANLAGWGPREGAAAWAFAASGAGAAQGVSTSVVYGVIALVATLPGGVVMAVDWASRGLGARGDAPRGASVEGVQGG
jgi:glycosyltransferase 2 family protein